MVEDQNYPVNPNSKILRELKRLIRKKFYFNMQLKIQSQQARKEDARKKIMLGGLFVKAELDHFHPHDPARQIQD